MRRFLCCALVALAVSCCAGCGARESMNSVRAPSPGQGAARSSGSRRALIVAISDYAPHTGWGGLHSENDVPLVRAALLGQGFEESALYILRDREATREGILRAIREKLLEPAKPGDVVVFHYSGHGQQITDDGEDELDGYDEALVPYDAPATLKGGYRGEAHLRDDTVNEMIGQLRRKVGSTGSVAFFLDTCFSGTPRGVMTLERGAVASRIVVRGGPPLGPPRSGEFRVESGSGFFEQRPVSRGTAIPKTESGLSPVAVFSAARHNQLAFETVAEDGLWVGSLSYAVRNGMKGAPTGSTYRWLYERVLRLMAARVRNEPQVEGDLDTGLLGGPSGPPPQSFVPIAAVSASADRVTLAAGSLAGLLPGARVEFHSEGAPRPLPGTFIASGRVVESGPVEAIVRIDSISDAQALKTSRAFVLDHAMGAVRIRVQLALDTKGENEKIRAFLKNNVGAVELVENQPDVIVYTTTEGFPEPHVLAETYADQVPLMKPLPVASPHLLTQLAQRLSDFARSRYLKSLRLVHPDFEVGLEMLPVSVTGCPPGQLSLSRCKVTQLAPKGAVVGGGPPVWRLGEYFKLKVRNGSSRSMFLNILDLASDGSINLIWPNPATADKTELRPRTDKEIYALYRIVEPLGTDVLLLIATEEWFDFRPFATARGLARGDGPDLSLSGAAATASVAFTVEP